MILPKELFLIRHGESLANCARREAEKSNSNEICFEGRESDVPLTELGLTQSERIGNWFAESNRSQSTVIICSPYTRTRDTADAILSLNSSQEIAILYDERIKERELGIFDRLTKSGALQKYPDECQKREKLGKFYYRPIGGESWADVALRVRHFLNQHSELIEEKRVLIVTHEVVIRIMRYVLEGLSEAEVLAIDRAGDVENGAITSYKSANGKLTLDLDNFLPK